MRPSLLRGVVPAVLVAALLSGCGSTAPAREMSAGPPGSVQITEDNATSCPMAAGTTAPADGSLSPAQGLWCKKFDWTQYPKFDAEATWSLPKGCTLSAKMMSGEWSGYENNPSGGYDMGAGDDGQFIDSWAGPPPEPLHGLLAEPQYWIDITVVVGDHLASVTPCHGWTLTIEPATPHSAAPSPTP